MYKRALALFALAAVLFTLLWWTQQRNSGSRAPEEYAATEKAMRIALDVWEKSGGTGKDPHSQWEQSWRQFAARYPLSEEAAKAHVWILSLMSNAGDSSGLADYLEVAVRYPDNTAVPAILDASAPLYLQGYGAEQTRRQLTQIADSATKRDNQASARYFLAAIETDDTRAKSALEQILSMYDGTHASEQAKGALEEIKVVGAGAPAPEFEFTDLTGKKITLRSLRGKWVLVDFWASWCPPCIVEIPGMKAIFADYQKNPRFAMLGVSLDYEREALQAMLQKEQMTWPQFMDGKGWDNPISRMYRVSVLPTTYLIGPDGVIRYRRQPSAELRKILARELG